jgi:hypothetical protein
MADKRTIRGESGAVEKPLHAQEAFVSDVKALLAPVRS